MRNFLFSLVFGFFLMFPVSAQEPSPAAQYETARAKASAGDYDAAISILRKLTEAHPENYDYQLYLARVYSWNKDYSEAIAVLNSLMQGKDYNPELLETMVNIQLWAGNYEEVIRYSEMALEQEDSNIYRVQKANALSHLNREKEALQALEGVLSEDPDHQEALYLRTQILKQKPQHLSLSYLNTSFSQPGSSPRHMGYLEYKRNLGRVPVLARFNYGHLNGESGGLFEIDAYPKLSTNSYLFLSAGAALDTPIFPEFRAGAEYFMAFSNGLGFSVGSKYLQFEEDEVLMFTGEASYYTRNNVKLSYRPYLSESEEKWFLSHALAFRLMNPLKESFWQLDLQYGAIPYGFYTSQDFQGLSAYRIGLQHQFRLPGNILVQPVFMYEYEEYLPSEFRNRFNVQLVTTLRF